MIIGIDMGHTLNPGNYGAIGIKNEPDETRNVGKRLISYLKCMGNTVVNVTQDYANTRPESLQKRVKAANAQKLDLFVSLHFNIADGKSNGSEVYTYGGKKLPAAVRVLNNLNKLGFKNRGIFDGSKLYVLKRTKAPAMLVEIAYIDSPTDMAIYKPDAVARALAEGITGKKIPQKCLGREYSLVETHGLSENDNTNIITHSLFKVTVGGYLNYDDARDVAMDLKDKGYVVSLENIT